MEEKIITPKMSLSADADRKLRLFSVRFHELWSNWESLKSEGITFGGSFTNMDNGEIEGPGCGVGRHRLKGFYLDYRVFHAEEEPTNVHDIRSLIGQHFTEDCVRLELRKQKEQWNNAGILHEWHGYKAQDLINFLFNGMLFHIKDKEKCREADRIKELLGDDLAHHCLTLCIYDRMLVIRNINWIISPYLEGKGQIRIPNPPIKA